MSNMVDSKLAKSVQKSVGRAKEKILQNLGKVDRTADEIFDEHVGNFNKQQCASTRLQKELNNYIRCIRACAGASRALLEAVSEVYEPEWGGKELMTINSQTSEMLWNDFAHRLAEQVLIPLNTYQAQFPEMRKKIEKRGRKMVDYDGERHALQALQSNPRRAEAKLARQRENLESAKRTYEVLNSELHEELPSLYGSRIVFLVSAMSTLFASENIFHSEASKVFAELEGIVERLSKESAKGALNHAKAPSNAIINNSDSPKDDGKNKIGGGGSDSSKSSSSSKDTNHINSNMTNGNSSKNDPSNCINAANKNTDPTTNNIASTTTTTTKITPTPEKSDVDSKNVVDADEDDEERWNVDTSNGGGGDEHLYVNVRNGTKKEEIKMMMMTEAKVNGDRMNVDNAMVGNGGEKDEKVVVDNNHVDSSSTTPASSPTDGKSPVKSTTSNTITSTTTNGPSAAQGNGQLTDSNANPNPTTTAKSNTNNSSSPTEKLPPGVLYRVRATYRYQKEDVDELSFEAGEIVSVVEYDDPEEQEEGWLMGIKDNGEKGMFPANFTRPL